METIVHIIIIVVPIVSTHTTEPPSANMKMQLGDGLLGSREMLHIPAELVFDICHVDKHVICCHFRCRPFEEMPPSLFDIRPPLLGNDKWIILMCCRFCNIWESYSLETPMQRFGDPRNSLHRGPRPRFPQGNRPPPRHEAVRPLMHPDFHTGGERFPRPFHEPDVRFGAMHEPGLGPRNNPMFQGARHPIVSRFTFWLDFIFYKPFYLHSFVGLGLFILVNIGECSVDHVRGCLDRSECEPFRYWATANNTRWVGTWRVDIVQSALRTRLRIDFHFVLGADDDGEGRQMCCAA